MGIDWDLVLRIAVPLACVLAGWALTRFTERKSRLITYYGHVGTLTAGAQRTQVNTHVVFIRNVGKKAATNVRVSHHVLPDFNIWPPVQHRIEEVADTGSDIVIPTLVPGEQITVSYLYFPPMTFAQTTRGVKSDEGFAQVVNVLLTRQISPRVQRSLWFLLLVGTVTVLYVLTSLAVAGWRRWH